MSRRTIMLLLISATAIVTAGVTAYYLYRSNAPRVNKFRQWMQNPAAHPDWKLAAGSQCGSAPFLFPTDGFAGFLWGTLLDYVTLIRESISSLARMWALPLLSLRTQDI